MKKSVAVTLCAVMTMGMVGSCTSVFAAEEPDPTTDEAVVNES